ncbi:retinol dehydrogenase 13 [Lasiosphaeria miniovina]|uniref:Retinol dehydrogenase 13 n=1 Tax=Lasiosphaeria miniovina TaxID=1954250 RepID=A0AA40DSG8_9PEZI|nr:retinol dehydrogenase 13 [Lasiosphaeria miniovina]KAK0710328.1 retinol dehydrogenase 13 [Lasiosphaeria miniovina]
MASWYNADTTASTLVDDLASEIKDKVILVTGVSSGGLGATFALAVAKARNPGKTKETANAIAQSSPHVRTRALELDLGSLAKVREAANQVNSWDHVPAIDVLVNNAGIMAVPYSVSPDGFESQLATNHLGPFLFTNLIMEKILASKSPRVVNVSSDGHRLGPFRFDDYNFHGGDSYNKWRAYGQSKTANMLFALSLAEKLGPKSGPHALAEKLKPKSGLLLAFSLHPGVITQTSLSGSLDWATDLPGLRDADKAIGNREAWEEFKAKTPEQGVATHVYAAFHPELKTHSGAYLQDSHIADPWVDTVKPWGTSLVEAEKLWKLSEKLVGQEFVY